MKPYHFNGHLDPLPPGVNLPLQLSGMVYLRNEVEACVAEYESKIRHLHELVTRVKADNASLKGQIRSLRRAAKNSNAPRRS